MGGWSGKREKKKEKKGKVEREWGGGGGPRLSGLGVFRSEIYTPMVAKHQGTAGRKAACKSQNKSDLKSTGQTIVRVEIAVRGVKKRMFLCCSEKGAHNL